MRGLRAAPSIVAFGAIALVACAQGDAVQQGYQDVGGGGYGGGYGGGDTTASTTSGSTTSSSTTTDSTTTTDTTTTTDSTTTTTTDTGAGGAGGGGGGQGGGPPPCDFSPPNACASAEELPAIDGDQGDDTRLEHGVGSKWYRVLVKEAVSSVVSYPSLSFTATLTSPADVHYDLYVYPGSGDGIDCNAAAIHASGVPEAYSAKWKDTPISDDSTWYVFEVRYVSGSDCDPGASWQLEIEGHTGG